MEEIRGYEGTVTIPTEEYKALIRAEVKTDAIASAYYSQKYFSIDDVIAILGIQPKVED